MNGQGLAAVASSIFRIHARLQAVQCPQVAPVLIGVPVPRRARSRARNLVDQELPLDWQLPYGIAALQGFDVADLL